ncbi:MAG TPA: hypothetical protein IAA57_03280 [Candidatus Pullilachnospira intestinigallinarum]|nr:hypothetical protein [Candidatus Pullilachnospira intestinigallinarum]
MKKKLENNLALKIFAVLIAVGMWLFVNNVDDPVITARYSVKVTVQNENYVYDAGKTYQIEEDARTVTVLIRGRESVVQNRSDLVVYANLAEIQDMDAISTYVPVTFREVSGIALEDVEIFPKVIPIRIEDSAQKEFSVEIQTEGETDKHYEIGEKTSDPEIVTIQGPESIIDKINMVQANVQLNGEATKTVKKTVQLDVIDKNGDVLTDDLEYLNFDIGKERQVTVTLTLWEIRENVRLKASYTGEPAAGYQVSRVTLTPDTISVAGSDEALETLAENGNTIEIPADLINVDGLSQDYKGTIDLSSLLLQADELKQVSDGNQSVQVQVSIIPLGSQEFEVPTSSIKLENLGRGLHAVFIRENLIMRIQAANADLANLNVSDIQASVNLEGLEAGSYSVDVNVTLPDGYELVDNVKADIQLTAIDDTNDTNE